MAKSDLGSFATFKMLSNYQTVVEPRRRPFEQSLSLFLPLFLPAPQFVFPYFFRFIVMHYISPLSFLSSLFSANVFFWQKKRGKCRASLFSFWIERFLSASENRHTQKRSKFASLSSIGKKNSIHGKNDPKVSLQAHFFVETSAVWVGWWVPNQKNLLIALLFDTL